MFPRAISKFCSSANSWHLSVHTCSSWTNSGTTKNVLQPRIFFDLRMSPNIWSPTYRTSFPFAPMSLVKMSQEPFRRARHNTNDYNIYQLVILMSVSKIYLPNILGLLAEAQCACPFSELQFWCPLVAGSCLHWKTTVFWHLPPLCRNTIASLCVARWATSGEKILLLYYYFCVTL